MSLARDLTVFAQDHTTASLAELEQAVLEQVRAQLPKVLEATISVATPSLQGEQRPRRQTCLTCGQSRRCRSWRKRQVQTVCGRISLTRTWYVCTSCGRGWSPTDEALGIAAQQRVSAGFEAYLVRLGAVTSFRDAVTVLELLSGWHVSPETVRQHTETAGRLSELQQQEAIGQVERTGESFQPDEPAPGHLVVETDGVMVRFRDGWHEVKLGVVGGQVAGQLSALSFVAAREPPDRFGPRLLTEAARRDALTPIGWVNPVAEIATMRHVTVLGDGAAWIWNLADEHFGTRTEIVDYYHACEHLWKVANSVFGAATPAASAWARPLSDALLTAGVAPVRTALTRLSSSDPTGAEVLRQEREYFRKNAARMDYPTFRALGLPIGSGAVESAAKYLVQARMKRPGSRWSDAGAQAILTLRSHFLSHPSLVA